MSILGDYVARLAAEAGVELPTVAVVAPQFRKGTESRFIQVSPDIVGDSIPDPVVLGSESFPETSPPSGVETAVLPVLNDIRMAKDVNEPPPPSPSSRFLQLQIERAIRGEPFRSSPSESAVTEVTHLESLAVEASGSNLNVGHEANVALSERRAHEHHEHHHRDMRSYALGGGDLGRAGVAAIEIPERRCRGWESRLVEVVRQAVMEEGVHGVAALVRQGIISR